MVRMRKDVWNLPASDKTLFWYGKAIEKLKARPITDVTSWWSLAAMHGIDRDLWVKLGYLAPAARLPFNPAATGFWNQCQHGSWYFLPWHRGYLGAFEAILLDVIVKEGGPADWALPYWNYDPDKPNKLKFPTAFADEFLDDGSKNPLWVKQRYGRSGDGVITIRKDDVPLKDLWDAAEFFDEPNELVTSFGGAQTGFEHGGQGAGQLEQVPHGPVHVLVGGTKRGTNPNRLENNGLMAMFETAGIDPIFWLHHANIDRLWEVWLKVTPGPGLPADAYKNPTNTDWLNEPAGAFVMPRPDGQTFTFSAKDVLNTQSPLLNYVYEDTAVPPGQADILAGRLESLGLERATAHTVSEGLPMASSKKTEMVGASLESVRIGANTTETRVQLDAGARDRLAATLSPSPLESTSPKAPDRVYLALENITSPTDAGVFKVYVNVPQGADPAQHPENLAGVVSLFGARAATKPDGPHAGNGLTRTLDITRIVDALHLSGGLNAAHLDVKFVPETPMPEDGKVDVRHIRIYRQSR